AGERRHGRTNALAGVQHDAFEFDRRDSGEGETTAVLVGEHVYEDIPDSPMSSAGSPPVVVDELWKDGVQFDDDALVRQEDQGAWLCPTATVMDDYIEIPSPSPPPPPPAVHQKLNLVANVEMAFVTLEGYRLELSLHSLNASVAVPETGDIQQTVTMTVPSVVLKDGRGRRILSRFVVSDAPPLPQLRVVVDAVKEPDVGDEYRVSVDLAPLRLSMRQETVEGLQRLGRELGDESSFEADFAAELVEWTGVEMEGRQGPRADPGSCKRAGVGHADGTSPAPSLIPLFIQRFELGPWLLVLDYKPQKANFSALRSGTLQELVNLFPFRGVKLRFRRLHVLAREDLGALGAAVVQAYVGELVRQAGKFVRGSGPVRPLVSVATALRDLFPAQATDRVSRSRLARELKRGGKALLEAIVQEALSAADSAVGATAQALERSPQAAAAAHALQQRVQRARGMR
ncbi:hypothetical protein H632_c1633p0, partial [Helicosporidium sp. ATCC 50920]